MDGAMSDKVCPSQVFIYNGMYLYVQYNVFIVKILPLQVHVERCFVFIR